MTRVEKKRDKMQLISAVLMNELDFISCILMR